MKNLFFVHIKYLWLCLIFGDVVKYSLLAKNECKVMIDTQILGYSLIVVADVRVIHSLAHYFDLKSSESAIALLLSLEIQISRWILGSRKVVLALLFAHAFFD